MKKQYDISKLKLVKRGPILKKDAKVQKTIRIDLDVLSWLVEQSAKRGIPYQTLLNSTLRQHMVQREDKDLQRMIRTVVRSELRKAG